MVRKPNFFIIGAPKCGTTAMSEYLRTHPNVFMSEPKEPSFFSEDVGRSSYRSSDEYLGLFARARPCQSVVAEASTRYIHSKLALPKIKLFEPQAKLMVMLRRPSDLVYAFHSELLRQGIESEQDFEKAWALQDIRASGKALPPARKNAHSLQYKWIGSLGSQMRILFRTFPRDQIHIITFDDFIANPGGEYRNLLSFLELPDDGRKEFPRINENIQYKWLWLGQFPKRLRGYVTRPLATLRRKTGFRGTGLIKTIDRFNAEASSRLPLRPEFRQYLDEVFSDEVKLLEELLGRDLSIWRGNA